MTLLAICTPVLPGKKEELREFIAELRGPRYHEFEMSRARLGVRERTFVQEGPDGDVVIITLEGEHPDRAFGEFGMADDEFTDWFVERVRSIHGIDLREAMPGHLPQQVIDSRYLVRV